MPAARSLESRTHRQPIRYRNIGHIDQARRVDASGFGLGDGPPGAGIAYHRQAISAKRSVSLGAAFGN